VCSCSGMVPKRRVDGSVASLVIQTMCIVESIQVCNIIWIISGQFQNSEHYSGQ
jgi:hypothetical protein